MKTHKAKRVYIDGSREIWEVTEDSGMVTFHVITPLGTFVAGSEQKALEYLVDNQGLLVGRKGGDKVK